MKNKTSLINKTALRKDILRYAPIWALYTIFLMLVLFGMTESTQYTMAMTVLDLLKGMAWINLFYGGICGTFLFMDLFNGRLCNALHAFPMRREGWLVTHILSGVLFSLVPNLLAAGIASLMLWEYAYMALIWLAISTLQYLFFFGTAVLAATCAGNLLGTVAIYGITHFITVFVYAVAELLYQPLLYGVRLNNTGIYRCFPLSQMSGFDYAKFEVRTADVRYIDFAGLQGKAWLYVGICAAVGILCLFLAGLVYRRRNLEKAGDFISLKPIAPVFLLVATVGAGAFLYMFSDLVDNKSYLFLVLGMAIGYFAGKMLLDRTLKVFGKKSLLTLAALFLVVGGSLCLTWLDPLGLTTYVPKADKIEAAYIYGADKGYAYIVDSFFSYRGIDENGTFPITDAAEVAELQDFHRQLTRYRPSKSDDVLCDVRIQYKLKNGRTMVRYYEVGRDTPLGQQACKYFSDMRYVFEVSNTEVLYNAFDAISIDIYEGNDNVNFKLTDSQEIAGLLDAIAADCEAGKMAQYWGFHDEIGKTADYNVEFYVDNKAIEQGTMNRSQFYLHIFTDSTNTNAYINTMRQLHGE
ncbi:MAG: hypothetical protein E7421_00705 [Ruminococcaceae bacterium]|nr:hypothetical protein [Oscillospiraceae bacterium]